MSTPTELSKITSAANPNGSLSAAEANDNIELILKTALQEGITDKGQLAYVLATAEHESGFAPIPEIWGPTAHQRTYEGRSDLDNTQPGDGYRFRGRGFVQITGRDRYTAWSEELGVDLVNNPDRALEPDIAVRILVQGMRDGGFRPVGKGRVDGGYSLDDFIDGDTIDFDGARNIINYPVAEQTRSVTTKAERFHQALQTVDLDKLRSELNVETSASLPPRTELESPTDSQSPAVLQAQNLNRETVRDTSTPEVVPQSQSLDYDREVASVFVTAVDQNLGESQVTPQAVEKAMVAGLEAALEFDPNISNETLEVLGSSLLEDIQIELPVTQNGPELGE